MRTLSLDKVRRHFEYCGVKVNSRYGVDELRWRMYQWKKLGLMYFRERLDQLTEDSEIDACFVFHIPEDGRKRPAAGFVPEPFPVDGLVYELSAAKHKVDRVGFLATLAQYKLDYEHGNKATRFDSDEDFGLYCAFIDRFYACTRPYRGKKVYWILFTPEGVDFFSQEFDLAPGLLQKFSAYDPHEPLSGPALH